MFGSGHDITLTGAEIDAEDAWLTSFGLELRAGSVLRERPFSHPLSNRSYVVPTEWYRQRPPEQVQADRLRRDLLTLRTVMEKAYGGWDTAENRGWDWNRWFSEWDASLAGRADQRLTLREAFAPLANLLEFQLDNHTGVAASAMHFGSGSRTAVLERKPTGPCTAMKTDSGRAFAIEPNDRGQQPKMALSVPTSGEMDQPVYYISYPARRGDMSFARCGDEWIRAAPVWNPMGKDRIKMVLELAKTEEDVPSYRTLSTAGSYFRLPTVTKQNGERLRTLIRALPATAGQEKVFIVDLRANEGGDAPIEALSRWVDLADLQSAARIAQRRRLSCLYTSLRWGYTQVTMAAVRPPVSEELRSNLQHALDMLFEPSPDGCPDTIDEVKSEWNYELRNFRAAPPPGQPRLLVLVDNACGSDGELMAYALAAIPGTLVAGTNTYGVAQFIQPGYFVLPHTRIPFRIALGTSDLYGDARSFDGYGLDIDILLSTQGSQSPEGVLRIVDWMESMPA